MRVISGKFRSRKLRTIESDDLRPTLGRTRESVFNILNHIVDFNNALVMDLYCGTGAYGIEALSRGAKSAYFIDKNPTHIELAKENLIQIDPKHQSQFICADICLNLPKTSSPADLIFIDPPYNSGLIPETLKQLEKQNWVNADTVILIEEKKGVTIEFDTKFEVIKNKNYGIAAIYVLKPAPSE